MELEQYRDVSEGLRDVLKSQRLSEGLTPQEMNYIREVLPQDWKSLNLVQQREAADILDNRLAELSPSGTYRALDADPRLKEALSPILHELPNEKLEAPQDYIQIEQISDRLAECKELRFENWRTLSLEEKIGVLNDLEQAIASISHRPSVPVYAQPLHMDEQSINWGCYDSANKKIVINSACLERSSFDSAFYNRILDTLVHEGRHAYQDYNMYEREVHPRQSEINSWRENEIAGYASGNMSEIGMRLYRFQPQETDARQFAEDTLRRLNEKLCA